MRYNVAELLRAPTGERRIVDIEARIDLGDPDIELAGPVRGELSLIRDHAGILVDGTLEARLSMACVRCLKPVEVDVELEVAEEFQPTVAVPNGPPAAVDEDVEPATLIDEHHVLDLTEIVRQGVLLAAPLHPVCRAACAGLCPTCGQDLNEAECACEPAADPRWNALREMLEEETADESP